jgi:hypothetical protein
MYRFRLGKTSWAVHIVLDGHVEFTCPAPKQKQLADGIYLVEVGNLLRLEELPQAEQAVLRFQDILDSRRNGGAAVITLTHFWYAATDYQLEGVEAAVASWLAETLQIPNPWLGGSYDRVRNRYDFQYTDGTVFGVAAR